MDWRWYKVRIKEFMKKFIILRYWAEDTIPSVTVVEQPEIEYYPQLYFHYDKNADDQYIDEDFTGSSYSQDISDNYQIHETLIPDDAIRFDATHEGYTEVFPKSDMNIYNSYDVFALNKKILPFMNYTITPSDVQQKTGVVKQYLLSLQEVGLKLHTNHKSMHTMMTHSQRMLMTVLKV